MLLGWLFLIFCIFLDDRSRYERRRRRLESGGGDGDGEAEVAEKRIRDEVSTATERYIFESGKRINLKVGSINISVSVAHPYYTNLNRNIFSLLGST